METFYTAYTKQIDSVTYYFVKKFSSFPDLKNVPPIMESYGMHIDFNKACTIAGVKDQAIKEQLLREAVTTLQQAKVIELVTGFSAKTMAR
jgi:hypothetical protein